MELKRKKRAAPGVAERRLRFICGFALGAPAGLLASLDFGSFWAAALVMIASGALVGYLAMRYAHRLRAGWPPWR